MRKWACRGSQRSARPAQRQPTVKAVMPSRFDPLDMPGLDVLDEEFGEDAAAVLRARRPRTGARLLMLAIVALGLGAIGALAFAWSNADGRLRFTNRGNSMRSLMLAALLLHGTECSQRPRACS